MVVGFIAGWIRDEVREIKMRRKHQDRAGIIEAILVSEDMLTHMLHRLEDRLVALDGKLNHTAYGAWKVIDTTKHANGTTVETAQRVVVKTKNDK